MMGTRQGHYERVHVISVVQSKKGPSTGQTGLLVTSYPDMSRPKIVRDRPVQFVLKLGPFLLAMSAVGPFLLSTTDIIIIIIINQSPEPVYCFINKTYMIPKTDQAILRHNTPGMYGQVGGLPIS